jgi:pimeloyl-ACP methyl ester carboxylesterase
MPLLTLSTGTVRYRESGATRPRAPLLLVHGAGTSSAIWLPTLHRLARSRRALAPDLPGHGRSAGAVASVGAMVAVLAELRDALGLPPAIVVGHSLGGQVALAYAATHPGSVAGLVLVTTGLRLEPSTEIAAVLEHRPADWPALIAAIGFSPDTPAEIRRRCTWAASPAQTLADFRAAWAFDGRPLLGGLSLPALVVAGADDGLAPPHLGAALAQGLRAPLVVVPRCGHQPMAEQSSAFSSIVNEFADAVG